MAWYNNYEMLSCDIPVPWNIPLVTCIFLHTHSPKGLCVYEENTSDSWDIPWYTTRKHCINSMYHLQTFTNFILRVSNHHCRETHPQIGPFEN